MKNNVLFFFALLLAFFSTFSIKAQVDPKYLAGAVPEKNGKVIFSDSVIINGISGNDIYERVLMWAEANFDSEKSNVVYFDKEKGIISCRGESELVFSSSALSLDRTFMNYQMNIFCEDNLYWYEIKSISYLYNVSNKQNPEKIPAEKWITDKEAVNKNKLYRNNGKFRTKTIDLVDDIHNSLAVTVNTNTVDYFDRKEKEKTYTRTSRETAQLSPEPTQKSEAPPAMPEPVKANENIQGKSNLKTENPPIGNSDMAPYKSLDPKKIPGNIIKLLSEDWMLITAGDDQKYNMMTASWGGLGYLWDKPVVYSFINPARYTYQIMESTDKYTLSFYTEAYRDVLQYCGTTSGENTDKVKESGLTPITMPSGSKAFSEAWMIIECKKILSQPIDPEAVFDPEAKETWSKKKFHQIYIGEILNVWIK